jgi:molybdate transport system ATP-binding protein
MTADPTINVELRLRRPDFVLDVALDLPGRGITALFGPSGSGKTSCLRAVAGLERAATGQLRVLGEVWQDDATRTWVPPHRRALGYVFQEASLFAHLSVHGNVVYGLKRVPAVQQRFALDQAVGLLGIAALMDRSPATLSGGERQRVAIARALATSPRLLLLDEPLAALDAARKQDILPWLEKLRDELDIPMLYVSHATDEVARLAETLVVLERGQVLAAGPVADVLSRLDLPFNTGDEASVLLDGTVAERDAQWHLCRVAFAGGSLWIRDSGAPVGTRARVRVLARDVSLSLNRPEGTSIANALPGTVEDIANDAHPGQAMLGIRVGHQVFLARVTRRSVHTLGLAAASPVWLQVKSAALLL